MIDVNSEEFTFFINLVQTFNQICEERNNLEQALDEIEKYINKAQLGEFPDGVIYWLKDDEVGKNLLQIIKKAKGEYKNDN